MIEVSIAALLTTTTLMVLLWLVSLSYRDVSIVDTFWGLGFALVATVSRVLGHDSTRGTLVVILVCLWGARLSLHLFRRNFGKPEDRRYRQMRKERGPAFTYTSLWIVFLLQGCLIWIISFPIQAVYSSSAPPALHWLDVIAAIVVLSGICFEATADWQLTRFKANPHNKGKVMDRGLWRYTRHPNYFGDAVVWWGLGLFALGGSTHYWTLISPIIMTVLLLKVSGVSLLEKDIVERRPEYANYIRKTSAFVPLPPKNTRTTV